MNLQFFDVRPDYIGHAFHEAQHLDRISLTPIGSGPPDEVDILIPRDPTGTELDWVFFVRRRQRTDAVCQEEPDLDIVGASTVDWLVTAPPEELRKGPLTPQQVESLIAHREAGRSIQSPEDLKQVPQFGDATVRKVQEFAAQQAFGLDELDKLCGDEYGIGLLDLLHDGTEIGRERRRRLAGVVLKRKFGESHDADSGPIGITQARRTWSWEPDKLKQATDARKAENGEAWVLDQLRLTMPSIGLDATWEELQHEAESERGLFKIAALWLNDTLKGRATRDWRAYYHAPESKPLKTALDIANALAQLPILGLITPILPAGPILGAIAGVLLSDGIEAVFVDRPDLDLPNQADRS